MVSKISRPWRRSLVHTLRERIAPPAPSDRRKKIYCPPPTR
jgi:hypothetical protein